MRCDTRYNTVEHLSLPSADSYDVMIVALLVRVTDRKGSVGLPADQVAAVRRLLARPGGQVTEKPVVVACFGSPYLVAQFPEAKTWLAVFSNVDVAQRAGARAMFGEAAIGGKIPVSVPGVVTAGSGLDVPANPMTLVAIGEHGRAAGAGIRAARSRGDGGRFSGRRAGRRTSQ